MLVLTSGRRYAKISVRGLAAFRTTVEPVSSSRGFGFWRRQVGAQAHRALAQELKTATTDTEVPISGIFVREGWQIEVHGRVDQITVTQADCHITEYKTTGLQLPTEASELEAAVPEAFDQLAIYLSLKHLKSVSGEPLHLHGDVLFENLAEGIRQSVSMSLKEAHLRTEARLEAVMPYLHMRWSRNQQRLQAPQAIQAPFAAFRSGQPAAIESLQEAALRSPVVLWQAPTGFGKTGIVLMHALSRLEQGHVSRLLLLSCKTTGQAGWLDQLALMLPSNTTHRALHLRSRADHQARCPRCQHAEACMSQQPGEHPHQQPGEPLPLWEALAQPVTGLKAIQTFAADHELCPYTLNRALLPYADIWLADVNYIFHPASATVLADVVDFAPAETLLVIDEAHNLPERVGSCFSLNAQHGDAQALLAVAHHNGLSRRFKHALEAWVDWLSRLKSGQTLDLCDSFEVADLLENLHEALAESTPKADDLPDWAWELLRGPLQWSQVRADERLEVCEWASKQGHLRGQVLDPGPLIQAQLEPFAEVLGLSATLEPWPVTFQQWGYAAGTPAPLAFCSEASWRQGSVTVAVDARVDTRLKARHGGYALTAQTLATLAGCGLAVAFFPSYAYARTVAAYVEALGTGLRIAVQPQEAGPDEQLRFVQENLLCSHLLCFVLGSRLSEGIDALGGHVQQAVVVGPALPEVNPLQTLRQESLTAAVGREKAFEQVYLVPGIRKVNQALGRLIRAPGQRARVLLLGKRYVEPRVQALLAEDYQGGPVLTSEADWQNWLSASQAHLQSQAM
jgi:Rad3-related DNA helicase